jgi:hypothetical protein
MVSDDRQEYVGSRIAYGVTNGLKCSGPVTKAAAQISIAEVCENHFRRYRQASFCRAIWVSCVESYRAATTIAFLRFFSGAADHSVLIRSSRMLADSSFGSCGTNSPRNALTRTDWSDGRLTGIYARWHMFEEKREAVMAIEAAVLPLIA